MVQLDHILDAHKSMSYIITNSLLKSEFFNVFFVAAIQRREKLNSGDSHMP